MPITLSEIEETNLSADILEEAVINRMIALINDLEPRIEALENP